MSGRVNGSGVRGVPRVSQSHIRRLSGLGVARGVGLLEFLLALLIFSTGMMGLISAQLAGKRASFDAAQRSTATALARDILERMRANPGQLAAYHVNGAGDASRRRPMPEADCDVAECTAAQLAAFDLWQWESAMVGESEQSGDDNTGGLVSPLACISGADGVVNVSVSWLGMSPAGPDAAADSCGSEGLSPGEQDKARRRHQLTITTFVAGLR